MPHSRCLVTGGAGFIGSHLVAALLDQRAHVTVLDDLSSGHAENVPKAATLIRGDIRDPRAVARSVRGQDYVFHLAAQVGNVRSVANPVESMEINVGGSIRL